MAAYTRVTVVGSALRCDVAVPARDPLAAAMPRVLDLVEEPVRGPGTSVHLVRDDGRPVALDRSPAEQALLDGTVLRLVDGADRPAPPQVANVTDEVGLALARRGDRWSARARWLTAAAALAAVGAAATVAAPSAGPVLLGVALLLAGALLAGHVAGYVDGYVDGRAPVPADGLGGAGPALALTGAALGAAVAVAVRSGPALWPGAGPGAALLGTATAVGLAVWLVLGIGVGVGVGRIDVLVGGLVGAGLAALVPAAAAATGPRPEPGAAFAAVAAVVACGLLPRMAVVAGGLAALDDRTLAGRLADRDALQDGVALAHTGLSWAVAAVAGALVVPAGVLLASPDPWAVGLGAAAVTVAATRTRVCPLVPQHAALWLAVAGAAALGWSGRPQPALSSALLVLALVAGTVVVAAAWRPSDHLRVRLRRAGDLVELLAVLGLAPAVLGLLGVYGDLLGRF